LLIFLDVETEGLSPWQHHVLQWASLFYLFDGTNLTKLAEFNEYQKIERELLKLVENLTGIDSFSKPTSPLRNGKSFSEIFRLWTELLKKLVDANSPFKILLIGHNIDFDLRFINHELIRNKLRANLETYFTSKVDTKQGSKNILTNFNSPRLRTRVCPKSLCTKAYSKMIQKTHTMLITTV